MRPESVCKKAGFGRTDYQERRTFDEIGWNVL